METLRKVKIRACVRYERAKLTSKRKDRLAGRGGGPGLGRL